MALEGTLFKYGPRNTHVAFINATAKPTQPGDAPSLDSPGKYLAFIAGLTEGLLSIGYMLPLAAAVKEAGWTLVQVQLSSSYQGYGVASLDRDADEMLQFSRALLTNYDAQNLVWMGHSTGCQDIVRFMQRHANAKGMTPLLGTILQAPASDREYFDQYPDLQPTLERAKKMVAAGRGEDIVTRDLFGDKAPICARRLIAWMVPEGDDDHFSSDLSTSTLEAILSPVGQRPCLLLISGADEAVPSSVDYPALAGRLRDAVGPSATLAIVDDAPHALQGHEDDGIAHVLTFLAGLN